jgi:hypothetical protein
MTVLVLRKGVETPAWLPFAVFDIFQESRVLVVLAEQEESSSAVKLKISPRSIGSLTKPEKKVCARASPGGNLPAGL